MRSARVLRRRRCVGRGYAAIADAPRHAEGDRLRGHEDIQRLVAVERIVEGRVGGAAIVFLRMRASERRLIGELGLEGVITGGALAAMLEEGHEVGVRG